MSKLTSKASAIFTILLKERSLFPMFINVL
nr:MAG TPA: hypothetical protein [Caudoviricetes sp.]